MSTLRGSVRTVAVALSIAMALALPCAADSNDAKRPPTDRQADRAEGHVEVPRDAYLPTPAQPKAPKRTTVTSRDGFVSVQVNVDGTGANLVGDAANEPSIAVDPTDPTKMAIGWRQFDNVSSDFRQAGWGYTTDGGDTWTFPGVIQPGVFRSDPVLTSDADGSFFYNSLTAEGSSNFRCHVFKSIDGGATWDGGVFAWGGDKQWQTIDTTDGIGRGNIYAAWNSVYSSCSGGFTRSYNGGQSFEACTTVAGDPHWGTLAVGPDGELYVSGTGMTLSKSSTIQNAALPHAWDFTRTVNLDGTLSFSTGPNPAGLLGQNWIAVDRSDGPTRGYVYMLASVERSSNPDPSDVMFARSTDGGVTWSAPVRVNDDIGTTAWQWFGTMSVAPNGRIDVVWLDTRNDALGGYLSELYYAYSEDAGVTWSPNVALTPAFDPHVGWPQQQKMGDYFDMVSDEFGANLAYAATFNGEQDVYYARIGDPACPQDGRVTLDRPKYACDGVVLASVLDCGLDADPQLAESVVVTVDSDSETGSEPLTLTETGPSSARFEGSIALSETDTEGVLWVTEGDTVTVTYVDADDGAGGFDVPVIAQATVDCTTPTIANVRAVELGPIAATIAFDSDEPVRGTVRYGTSCTVLDRTATARGFTTAPAIGLAGLTDATTYFYVVDAEDQAGNVASDDNAGACFTFTTTDVPDFFTEQFVSGVDLAGKTLTFVPNGSTDFYDSCVEPITRLPTDPVGGRVLSLSDDASATAVLGGGRTVSLYGVSYPSFHVSSNGYLTFVSGDSDYTESYADHFAVPRVAALFDDLNPATGGTVSWKQLDDRAVATWQGVPEVSSGGSNTFQIELHFDGTITISYLGITCPDAIAGLSAGGGLPPVFVPSDLSVAGSCGPRPPTASPATVNTPTGTPVEIALQAADDGLPSDPGRLTYVIVSLPAGGYLEDLGAGSITAVPYALVDGGNRVLYAPAAGFESTDNFAFVADDGGAPPEGGPSAAATITVTQGGPRVLYDFALDDDPGWAKTGQWAFGVPTGGGSHNLDPTSGATGTHVYGYNLFGDYANNMAVETLTTTPLDLTGATDTRLEFRRWLGIESASYDHASVQVSADGATWTTVWNHTGGAISETAWSSQSYDVSAVADGRAAVRFRWTMGTTDGSVTYPGWNLDDIRIVATVAASGCTTAPGEVLDLRVRDDRATLDWMPPADLGGPVAPVFDVVRATAPDGFDAAACVEANDGADSFAIDADVPAPGDGFYYLVRAENPCGVGSWGQASGGAERGAGDCVP